MKLVILAVLIIAAFAFVEVERDIVVGGVGGVVGGYGGYGHLGGYRGYGGYGNGVLTDFNHDGIPDQYERGVYGGYGNYYGGYPHHYGGVYGGYGGVGGLYY